MLIRNQGNFVVNQWKSIEINENIKSLIITALSLLILKLFLLFAKISGLVYFATVTIIIIDYW